MPRHIHHSGIDAQAANHQGMRVYLISTKGTPLGVARELSRNDWMFWKSFEAMAAGESRNWWHDRKLETIMELLAREAGDQQERIVHLNPKDESMTPMNLTANEKSTAIRRVDHLLTWHQSNQPIADTELHLRILEHRNDMSQCPKTQAMIDDKVRASMILVELGAFDEPKKAA